VRAHMCVHVYLCVRVRAWVCACVRVLHVRGKCSARSFWLVRMDKRQSRELVLTRACMQRKTCIDLFCAYGVGEGGAFPLRSFVAVDSVCYGTCGGLDSSCLFMRACTRLVPVSVVLLRMVVCFSVCRFSYSACCRRCCIHRVPPTTSAPPTTTTAATTTTTTITITTTTTTHHHHQGCRRGAAAVVLVLRRPYAGDGGCAEPAASSGGGATARPPAGAGQHGQGDAPEAECCCRCWRRKQVCVCVRVCMCR
jgi:hypothetical protein